MKKNQKCYEKIVGDKSKIEDNEPKDVVNDSHKIK